MTKLIYLSVFTLIILLGCKKEDNSTASSSVPPPIKLDSAFIYHTDSCCIDIPNVFTPNSDGINDYLYVHCMNVMEFHLRIYNTSHQLVFSSDTLTQYFWDGKQQSSSGMQVIKGSYLYQFNAISTSGIAVSVSKYIRVIKDPFNECLLRHPAALCGDMIDARYCGPMYQTVEMFCFEN